MYQDISGLWIVNDRTPNSKGPKLKKKKTFMGSLRSNGFWRRWTHVLSGGLHPWVIYPSMNQRLPIQEPRALTGQAWGPVFVTVDGGEAQLLHNHMYQDWDSGWLSGGPISGSC